MDTYRLICTPWNNSSIYIIYLWINRSYGFTSTDPHRPILRLNQNLLRQAESKQSDLAKHKRREGLLLESKSIVPAERKEYLMELL